MTKSLENIKLFLDDDPGCSRLTATARYVIADGTALRTETMRVEHPALTAPMSAMPQDVWVAVVQAIRMREGLDEPMPAERKSGLLQRLGAESERTLRHTSTAPRTEVSRRPGANGA